MSGIGSIRPRAALKIGVIGHRRGAALSATDALLHSQIVAILRNILKVLNEIRSSQAARQFYRDEPPALAVISSLASGADCIGAKAAIDEGIALDAILPFPLEAYSFDFLESGQPSAITDLEHVRGWLAANKIRSTLTLPQVRIPSPGDNSAAYELAGRILLDQSDLILAIWNGGESGGRGGTRRLIDRAVRRGTPVIHLDSAGENVPRLLWAGLPEIGVRGTINNECEVEDLLALKVPVFESSTATREFLDMLRFLAEPPCELSDKAVAANEQQRHSSDPLLRSGAETFARDRAALADYLADSATMSLQNLNRMVADIRVMISPFGQSRTPPETPAKLIERMLEAFAAADTLAIRHARWFRLAVRFIFACAGLALVFAVLGHAHDSVGWRISFAAAEFTALTAMAGAAWWGRRRSWHRRWIDAREVAEQLRLTAVFWTLGLWPWSITLRDERDRWIERYVRAYMREQSLCGDADNAPWSIQSARAALIQLVRAQIGYHQKSRFEMEARAHKYTLASTILLGCVLVILGAFVLGHFWASLAHALLALAPHSWFEWAERLLPVLTTTVAAISFGAFGLKTTLDFEGVAERSARSAARLEDQLCQLEKFDGNVRELHAFAANLAKIMLEDLRNWRLQAESRVLDMPG